MFAVYDGELTWDGFSVFEEPNVHRSALLSEEIMKILLEMREVSSEK
jgi:hypothetical protein